MGSTGSSGNAPAVMKAWQYKRCGGGASSLEVSTMPRDPIFLRAHNAVTACLLRVHAARAHWLSALSRQALRPRTGLESCLRLPCDPALQCLRRISTVCVL